MWVMVPYVRVSRRDTTLMSRASPKSATFALKRCGALGLLCSSTLPARMAEGQSEGSSCHSPPPNQPTCSQKSGACTVLQASIQVQRAWSTQHMKDGCG